MSNTITVAFQSSTGGFNKGLNSTRKGLGGLSKDSKRASVGVGSLVKVFAGFQILSKASSLISESVAEARESNKIAAQTGAVIKATGGIANVTAKDVDNLATRLSNKTAVDDEAIATGANLLLTFKNVRNEVGRGNKIFDRATGAAVDLSAAGFGSVDSASKMLGKALNDPLKGITALSRAGVTFTQGQKDQIKTLVESGDTLSAQRLILKEVESQVGGSAAAQATAGERLKVVVGNIKEDIGNGLIPILERGATFLANNLPGAIAAASGAFGSARSVVSGFVSGINFGPLLGLLSSLKGSASGAFSSMREAAGPVATAVADLARFLAPVVTLLGKVAAAGAFVALKVALAAVSAGFTLIRGAASGLSAALGFIGKHSTAFQTFGIVLGTVLAPALVLLTANVIANGIAAATTTAAWAAYAVVTKAMSVATKVAAAGQWLLNAALTANPIGLVVLAIAGLVAGLIFAYKKSETFRNIVNGAFAAMKTGVSVAVKVVSKVVRVAFLLVSTYIKVYMTVARTIITTVWRVISTVVRTAVNLVKGYVRGIIFVATFIASVFNRARSAVTGGVGRIVGAARQLPGKIKSALSNLGSLLLGIGSDIVSGLANGIRNGIGRVMSAARSLADAIPGPIKKALGIASPSRVAKKLGRFVSQGLALGILDGGRTVDKAVLRLQKSLNKRLKKLPRNATKAQRRAYAKADRKRLADIRKNTKAVGKALLNEGRAELKARVKQSREYASAVANSAREFAGLSSITAGENESLSAATITQGLRDRLAAIKNFNTKLKALQKAGLSKDLYNQIVQMGVENGTAYAEALAAGGPSAIKEANSLNSQVSSAASALGKNTAANMYKAGIDSAAGYVRGLESLVRKINRSGTKIAKSLVRSLKRALGIRSPSRVFKGIGQDTVRGLNIGLDDKTVRAQGANLGKALVTGFKSPQMDAQLVTGYKAYGKTKTPTTGGTYIEQINVTVDSSMTVEQQGREYKKAIKAAEKIGY